MHHIWNHTALECQLEGRWWRPSIKVQAEDGLRISFGPDPCLWAGGQQINYYSVFRVILLCSLSIFTSPRPLTESWGLPQTHKYYSIEEEGPFSRQGDGILQKCLLFFNGHCQLTLPSVEECYAGDILA